EGWGRLTGREPFVTLDSLRMARQRMYFSSAKAERELGYRHRPATAALADAVEWYRQQGMLP
ncbi:MAG TPA: NAD-dependent dehydratase, partial [Magnetospirillum sp.]|nr:NAD-dependent dehydratase [Magnetospirillum sp.]